MYGRLLIKLFAHNFAFFRGIGVSNPVESIPIITVGNRIIHLPSFFPRALIIPLMEMRLFKYNRTKQLIRNEQNN